MYIIYNPIVHERAKHIEAYCRFIRNMVMQHQIDTLFVASSFQLGEIFTTAWAKKVSSL